MSVVVMFRLGGRTLGSSAWKGCECFVMNLRLHLLTDTSFLAGKEPAPTVGFEPMSNRLPDGTHYYHSAKCLRVISSNPSVCLGDRLEVGNY